MPIRSRWSGALVFAVFLLSPAAARAELVVIDANAYAAGTNITNMFAGLSMATLTPAGSNTLNSVRSEITISASSYASYFGSHSLGIIHSGENYAYCRERTLQGLTTSDCQLYRVQEFSFASATNFFEIEAATGPDGISMWAFDAAGNLLSHCFAWGSPSGPCGVVNYNYAGLGKYTLTFNQTQTNIARVVVGGWYGTANITRLTYNNTSVQGVPEPGTLAMMAIAMVGVGLRRRRRAN